MYSESMIGKYSNNRIVILHQNFSLCLQPLNLGIIQSFKVKYRKKVMCCELTWITSDHEASNGYLMIVNRSSMRPEKTALKNMVTIVTSNDEVDEKFISLFIQLNSQMQTDSDMTVEHSNFDYEVCTSLPVITSDKVNLRWIPIKASLEE